MCSLERYSGADYHNTRNSSSGGSAGMVLQRIQQDINVSGQGSTIAYREERSCINCIAVRNCWSSPISPRPSSPNNFTVRAEKTPEQMIAYWNRIYAQMCTNFRHFDPNIMQRMYLNKDKTADKQDWEV